jgi:PhnB protein
MPDDALLPDNVKVEQLDHIIDALLTGQQPRIADPELAPLAEIAAALRELPDEGFQKRLKSDLQRRVNMTTSAATPIREGLRTITPYIVVPNGSDLIDFLKRTFDAEETSRHPHGSDGFVARVKVGDSDLLIMGGESVRGHERIGAFHVFVPDCDATFNRAVEAGGTSLGEPADRPYGERSGFVKDASGNYWYIATRLGGSVYIEGLGTVTPYAHPMKARPFIDFVKKAFDAQELAVYEQGGRVMHAAVRIGDTVMEMGESPDFQPSSFYLHVEDCDAAYQRALDAGATSLWPPTDQAYGDRTAGVLDPFGYQWMPATRLNTAG